MYLLDTNIYIAFYERYYPQRNFPSFWERLVQTFQQEVVVPRVVMEETEKSDWLNTYMTETCGLNPIDHRKYLNQWAEVLKNVRNNPAYRIEAVDSYNGWSKETVADAWLLAIAKEEKYILVTEETKNVNLYKGGPVRSAKIPDVAEDIGVECIDRLEFFKRIELSI
ncbi:DUF4411 family protein [Granulicatella adiacens]|jgi:hypothetical protein|uniref:DUF4411 family protein n=1 Tax=Granulicatella adiacens TaxID=46124 RepID=UPI004029CBF6